MAIEQIDLVRDAGTQIDCVLADAGYGDANAFRDAIAERGLHYAVGVGKATKVFTESPTFEVPASSGKGRPRTRKLLTENSLLPITVEEIARRAPSSEWHRIAWRKGTKGDLQADFLLLRVTPANKWHRGREHETVWLICERTLGSKSVRKFYFSNLPARIAAKKLVAITHERWAIEQHYRDMKQEASLDHFEGRSYPGLQRHMALTALAYSFLETERHRKNALPGLTIGATREAVTEVVVFMLFELGEAYAARAAAFIRDHPKV